MNNIALHVACTSGSVSTWFTKHINFGSTQREIVTLNSRQSFLNTVSDAKRELFGTCNLIWLGKRTLGRAFLPKDFLFHTPPPRPPSQSIFNLIMFCSLSHKSSVTWLCLYICIQEYFPFSGSKSILQLWLDYKLGQGPGAFICFSFVFLPGYCAK